MLANQIRKNNSVCVNVRRGDFILNSYHNVCDLRYYREAETIISSKIQDPYFYIFSDDIEWCKSQEWPKIVEGIYLNWEFNSNDDLTDLYLMGSCDHFIMAASTFSWWASRILRIRDEKAIIIAPYPWLNIQSDWKYIYCSDMTIINVNSGN